MQPDQFQVNQTWLAYRINVAPMQVEGKAIDLYVLQDAASMFLFGNAFAPHGADGPAIEDVQKLLESARRKRNEWPTELVLPGKHGPANSFIQVAKREGVFVRTVPESHMSFYIKDTQEAYEQFLSRGDSDA